MQFSVVFKKMACKEKEKKRRGTFEFCALIEPNEVTALNKKKNLRKKESYATENKKTIHAYESLAEFSQRGALFS